MTCVYKKTCVYLKRNDLCLHRPQIEVSCPAALIRTDGSATVWESFYFFHRCYDIDDDEYDDLYYANDDYNHTDWFLCFFSYFFLTSRRYLNVCKMLTAWWRAELKPYTTAPWSSEASKTFLKKMSVKAVWSYCTLHVRNIKSECWEKMTPWLLEASVALHTCPLFLHSILKTS